MAFFSKLFSHGGASVSITIADSAPLTLQFVIDDYLHHMLEHLRHMGVAVDDLAAVAAP